MSAGGTAAVAVCVRLRLPQCSIKKATRFFRLLKSPRRRRRGGNRRKDPLWMTSSSFLSLDTLDSFFLLSRLSLLICGRLQVGRTVKLLLFLKLLCVYSQALSPHTQLVDPASQLSYHPPKSKRSRKRRKRTGEKCQSFPFFFSSSFYLLVFYFVSWASLGSSQISISKKKKKDKLRIYLS
jgi:hypothetical protein